MWSEHCSYKSSSLNILPTAVRSYWAGPSGENAGTTTSATDGPVLFAKIESHNHPSFIEPFQGAATGATGILLIHLHHAARPVAVMDALRFGSLDDPSHGARNKRILEGVVSGIAHYGNCFGVPTVGGECVFDPSYGGNPLVNVFALGVFRHDEIFYGRASGVGNPVIYVGAKTGKDGVHGATMASAEFTEESKQKRPNVQVGDPFMEKLLMEACLEAMKTGAIVGIQDMGAAGLTCSTCEMGSRAGTGIEIDLALVPQRESGMSPYEIMLSESQERMLLVADKGREDEVFAVFKKWGLDAVEIGTVTGDGILRVKDHGVVVAEIPNRPLADEAPLYDRPHDVAPYRRAPMEAPAYEPKPDHTADLFALLESEDLCSKRWIWEQYDYMVRTNTVQGPGSDAAIIRIKETGTSVAMALDGNGRYSMLGAREAARLIVAECCRNLSTSGALPVAATNNLNFGNPERPEIMAQLVESIEGMSEACSFFETPITGGNVSLYNETLGEPIYPTPVIGIVGMLPTGEPVGSAFRTAGRAVILLGGVGECEPVRFGGTQYARTVLGATWGLPPALDMDYETRVQQAMREVARANLAESAHDISDGGLAVALAESSFGAAGVGARIVLETGMRADHLLFHEGPSRILIATADPDAVLAIAARHGVEAVTIGETAAGRITIGCNGHTLIDCDLEPLRERWERALPDRLHSESERG
ncbi:MAG: phosphoribosylformylglycinamidine synthase subunit PurL [Bryobacteraceae bacterium]